MLSEDVAEMPNSSGEAAGTPGFEDASATPAGSGELSIDLNCDMGEGMDTDAAIFPFISSANIACGYHAGDADTMRRTVELALKHHVAIGAHPSYLDRENFGRIDILGTKLKPEEIPGMVVDQLILLQAICDEFGARLHHVKPHGALYNRAAKDAHVSALICRAIREFDPSLLLYGLSGSEMKKEAQRQELSFISEVFADRTYQEDGSLTPRTQPDALIEDPQQAIAQVVKMIREGRVFITSGPAASNRSTIANGSTATGRPTPSDRSTAPNGSTALDRPIPFDRSTAPGGSTASDEPTVRKAIALVAETICLHGDGSHAIQFAQLIHTTLLQSEIKVKAPF